MTGKFWLLYFFILGQILDGLLTFFGIERGFLFFKEINFFSAWLMAKLGLALALLAVKSFSIGLGVLIFFYCRRTGRWWSLAAVTVFTWLAVIYRFYLAANIIYFLAG